MQRITLFLLLNLVFMALVVPLSPAETSLPQSGPPDLFAKPFKVSYQLESWTYHKPADVQSTSEDGTVVVRIPGSFVNGKPNTSVAQIDEETGQPYIILSSFFTVVYKSEKEFFSSRELGVGRSLHTLIDGKPRLIMLNNGSRDRVWRMDGGSPMPVNSIEMAQAWYPHKFFPRGDGLLKQVGIEESSHEGRSVWSGHGSVGGFRLEAIGDNWPCIAEYGYPDEEPRAFEWRGSDFTVFRARTVPARVEEFIRMGDGYQSRLFATNIYFEELSEVGYDALWQKMIGQYLEKSE